MEEKRMESKRQVINGRETKAVRWPAENPKAKVIIVHGLGEHVSRYDVISEEFNAAGLEMVGFDQRGHGDNPGKKGHVDSFDEFLKDLDAFVKSQKGDLPLFILGHSLGGLISARYLEEYPGDVKGAVLSSGAFSASNVSGFLKAMSGFFSVLIPGLSFSNNIDPKTLSRNDGIVSDYTSDPLVHSKITARAAKELFRNVDVVLERASKFGTPVLMMAGSEDVVVPPDGVKKLFSAVSSKDKELKIFEGAYHEIFCDPEYSKEFRAKMIGWISERC